MTHVSWRSELRSKNYHIWRVRDSHKQPLYIPLKFTFSTLAINRQGYKKTETNTELALNFERGILLNWTIKFAIYSPGAYLKFWFRWRNNTAFSILFMYMVFAIYISFGGLGWVKCALDVAICKQWIVDRRVAVPAHLRCREIGVKLNTIASWKINNKTTKAAKPVTKKAGNPLHKFIFIV